MMKIILGASNSGKTSKAVEIAEDYIKEKKVVKFISKFPEEIAQQIIRYGIDTNYILNTQANIFNDLIKNIVDKKSDVIFIDDLHSLLYSKRNLWETLDFLEEIERFFDLDMYIVSQATKSSNLSDVKLIDYKDFIKMD